mmetsp:Transcript_7588/g.12265  ORF Transcript_7588/g.12265 Transcript_7588/m.12265 type:complete len:201 (-) Transcript_7588:299-901(-)
MRGGSPPPHAISIEIASAPRVFTQENTKSNNPPGAVNCAKLAKTNCSTSAASTELALTFLEHRSSFSPSHRHTDKLSLSFPHCRMIRDNTLAISASSNPLPQTSLEASSLCAISIAWIAASTPHGPFNSCTSPISDPPPPNTSPCCFHASPRAPENTNFAYSGQFESDDGSLAPPSNPPPDMLKNKLMAPSTSPPAISMY